MTNSIRENTESLNFDFEVSSGKYTVRLAKNRAEIESALRLRFHVFNIELGEGLEESYETKLDEDQYDQFCDHLIVIENTKNTVVGTYRVQDNDSAENGVGFYTSNEFEIEAFPESILKDAFELGRACIDINHRNGRVLFLLWRGLAKYMLLSEKRFLFGCCSITSQDTSMGIAYYKYLKEHNHMHPDYLIKVKDEFLCQNKLNHKYEGEVKLPQLFRLYMDIGCMVCSPPALDQQFKTIDFLVLLDLETISEQTRALFLK
ncbi:MAG: GNAT family N-acyltransferase [Balneola sp.]